MTIIPLDAYEILYDIAIEEEVDLAELVLCYKESCG